MSTANFTYCILNYVHSQLLDEKLNVGILFHFKNSNEIIFKRPKSFKRLKELYPNDFAEWQLKTYLNAIEEKVFQLNSKHYNLFSESKFEKLISEEVLKKDATALKFSDLKTGVVYAENYDTIINDYFRLFFSNYPDEDFKREIHNEEYLSTNFKRKLFSKSANYQNLIKRDVIISSPDTDVKFEYEWRNGVDNYVKTIGLDLEDVNYLNEKAILIHGQLSFIADIVKEKKGKIDLIVSRPVKKDRKYSQAYDKALVIINKAKIDKEIIEEEQIDKYVDKVAKEIKPPVHISNQPE